MYQGTMKSILSATKSTLLAYRKKPEGSFLDSVQTWKLGILSAATVFPAIAILPDYDQIVRWYSGRRALMERGFILAYYEKGVNMQALDRRVNDTVEKICDLLLKARHLKSPSSSEEQGFDLTVGSVNLNASSDVPIASCTATFAVRSIADFSALEEDSFEYGSAKSLNEAIVGKLEVKARTDPMLIAAVVHGMIDDSTVLHYPAVLMKDVSEQPDTRTFAGINKKPVSYIFNVCVRSISDDKVIFQLFNTVEAVRKLLIQSEKWGGLALNSEVGRIEYLQDRLREAPVYVAQIPYTVEMMRQTSFVGE